MLSRFGKLTRLELESREHDRTRLDPTLEEIMTKWAIFAILASSLALACGGAPAAPETPEAPEAPAAEAPEAPEAPEATPEAPEAPEAETPEAPAEG